MSIKHLKEIQRQIKSIDKEIEKILKEKYYSKKGAGSDEEDSIIKKHNKKQKPPHKKTQRFDESKTTYKKVPRKEPESRSGLKDIEWSNIRNKETKKIAQICLFDILKHYKVQDKTDLDEREFKDTDLIIIRACLSVIEGMKPMPWQLKLIKEKQSEILKNKKRMTRKEFI